MNDRLFQTVQFAVLLLLLLLPITLSHAQSEPEAAGGLRIEHSSKSSISTLIPLGTKVRIATEDGQMIGVYRGILEGVTDSVVHSSVGFSCC